MSSTVLPRHSPLSLRDLAARSFANALADDPLEHMEALRSFPPDYIAEIVQNAPWELLHVLWRSRDPFFSGHISADTLDAAVKLSEDRYRQLFACQRTSSRLKDPHLLLLDVFKSKDLFERHFWAPRRVSATAPFAVLFERSVDAVRRSARPAPSVVPSFECFRNAFDVFSGGLLRGLDWKRHGLLAAGGSVLACLMPLEPALPDDMEEPERLARLRVWLSPSNSWRCSRGAKGLKASPFVSSSDVDLFLYGAQTDAEANEALEHVYSVVQSNSDHPCIAVRAQNAVTFAVGWPRRHIQVVLRRYMSPAEVLLGFDLDASALGFDGERCLAMPRSLRSLNLRYNVVDLSRRSLTFESRLYKYAKRGFGIAVPGLDRRRVDPRMMELGLVTNSYGEKKGLKRLLLLERIDAERRDPAQQCCAYVRNADNMHYSWMSGMRCQALVGPSAKDEHRTWRNFVRHCKSCWRENSWAVGHDVRVPTPNDEERLQRREARAMQVEAGVISPILDDDKCDYSNLSIPFGERWTNKRIIDHLKQLSDNRQAAIDNFQFLEEDTDGEEAWYPLGRPMLGKLRAMPMAPYAVGSLSLKSTGVMPASGSKLWLSTNPGAQGATAGRPVMMTGSFHASAHSPAEIFPLVRPALTCAAAPLPLCVSLTRSLAPTPQPVVEGVDGAEPWAAEVMLPPGVHEFCKVVLTSCADTAAARKELVKACQLHTPDLIVPVSRHWGQEKLDWVKPKIIIRQAATPFEAERLRSSLATLPAIHDVGIEIVRYKLDLSNQSDDEEGGARRALPVDLTVMGLRGDATRAHWRKHKKNCSARRITRKTVREAAAAKQKACD